MRGSKGLDPLVATIVLIIIVVVIAAAVANWQSWFLPKYTGQLGDTTRTQLQCIRAGISLDNITFDCRNNCLPGVQHNITASIRNTGDISLPMYNLILENPRGMVLNFPLNTVLAIDDVFDYSNISADDCTAFKQSVSRITILTACTSMPSVFDGSLMRWINC